MRRHSFVGLASFLAVSTLLWGACGDEKPHALVATGGSGATGGATGGAGGAATGGAGGGVAPVCSASFTALTDGASLGAANGGGVGVCMTDGFHANITVATSQPDGTNATLSVGSGPPSAPVQVMNSVVTFSDVLLPQQTNLTLKVAFSSTCSVSVKVNVDCSLPTCSIAKPTLTNVHPALNGVPATSGGDRASAAGAAYQVAFAVQTNVEDGQPVKLTVVNNAVTGQQTILNGTATAGLATFPGVTLVPDGTYNVQASCTNKAGVTGYSTTPAPYLVDTLPPDLTISSPANDAFMGPSKLTNGAFQVCAKTTAMDAVGLPEALGADAAKNLRVYLNNGTTPVGTAAVTAAGTDACANVICPGGAPFSLRVTLADSAGNLTEKTVTGVSCDSALPSVQVVSPTGDAAPYADVTRRLLASSSSNALKDQDAVAAGAQWTVVACADRAGMATLVAGLAGQTLQPIKDGAGATMTVSTVAATASDNCPTGYNYVAKFANATLPDSAVGGDGKLMTATELRAQITAASTAVGTSAPVDLWVDTTVPSLAAFIPSSLCGGLVTSDVDVIQQVRFASNAPDGTLTVTNGGTAVNYPVATATGGFLDFGNVTFKVGGNTVTATATEPSGNATSLPVPCVYSVGNPPIVAWETPISGQNFCASTTTGPCLPDTDGTMPGWQGVLKVKVTMKGTAVTSGTVTFMAGATTLGMASLDANGEASLTVSLPDSTTTTMLTATTSAIGSSGTAAASLQARVDTVRPSTPTALTGSVLSRRKTSYQLSWTAGQDGAAGTGPTSYLVRYVKGASLTTSAFASAVPVTFTGTPVLGGATQTLNVGAGPNEGLLIETPYTFGVVAVDSVGNQSDLVTVSPTPAAFKSLLLSGPTMTEIFGARVDASADFNKDGKVDLLVGPFNGTAAYLYFGAPALPAMPSVTFTSSSTQFGRSAIACGDIDGDGFEDLAISSPAETKVFVFSGKKIAALTVPATVPATSADYVISGDATLYAGAFFGWQMARLGDFNQDGVDDFAVSAHGFNSSTGRVLVVLGTKAAANGTPTFTSFTLDDNAGARALWIDGEAVSSRFGINLFGLGKFLETGGTTLVASATGYGNNAGRVYAFGGAPGLSGMSLSSATALHLDGVANSQAGYALAAIGATSGLTPFALSMPLAGNDTGGVVRISFPAAASDGPFGGRIWTATDSKAATPQDRFGYAILGGLPSGRSTVYSIVGSPAPDLGIIPNLETAQTPTLYIVDGAQLSGATGTSDVSMARDIALPLSAYLSSGPAWQGTSRFSQIGGDMDGDGYADLFIGEFKTPSIQGRLIILY